MNRFDDAIEAHKTALKIFEKNDELHIYSAYNYHHIGVCLRLKKKYTSALGSFNRCLSILVEGYKPTNHYDTPIVKNVQELTLCVSNLEQKAIALFEWSQLEEIEKEPIWKSILKHLQAAIQLIDRLRQSYKSEDSEVILAGTYTKVFELGLLIAIKLYKEYVGEWKEAIIQFAEKAKATILLTSMQESFAKTIAKISTNLIEQERQLRIELAYLDKSIQNQEARGNGKDEKMLEEWRNQFFHTQQKYTQLIQHFEKNYPDYYQLKYQTETTSVETIQETLSENQWMVNYFVGETHFYIFFIGKGVFEVLQYEKTKSFETLVEGFLQSIQQHNLEEYEQKAYELYQRLLQPVEVYLMDMLADVDLMEEEGDSNDIPQLIVIPHDILNYVPFEALVCTRPGRRYDTQITDAEKSKAYQSLDYLLLHCEVSYHYSATLWHYLQKQQQSKNKIIVEKAAIQHDFVGFAPVYESKGEKASSETLQAAASSVRSWATRSEALRSDGTWTPLPYSKVETEQIAHLFTSKGLSSKTFLHEKATKEQFRETVEQSRFLLIAAHGVVNDERPKLSGLVFYPPSQPLAKLETVAKVSTPKVRTLATVEDLANSSSDDCILSMEETYHLNLQKTDLVVLSSCESGIGELAKGEGMMAVNRGFLYAGAKNVVSTLFKVYDKPSSLLTQYLFEGVLEGMDYTMALRRAKLRLLKLKEVDVKSWCGFVLIGGN